MYFPVYNIKDLNTAFKEGLWIICTPLFKTEDGVEIAEGDTFWSVTTTWNIDKIKCTKDIIQPDGFVDFSTKEAAEQYVNKHKPIYSKQDIVKKFPELSGKL